MMSRYFTVFTAILFLFPVFALAEEIVPAAPSSPPAVTQIPEQSRPLFQKPKEENFIILNFDNADLRDVINTISAITKENFILSPGVDAKVTIHSSGRIPSSDALSVFESILEVNNMALVKSGKFYKIVPGAAVKQKPLEVQKGRELDAVPSEDKPITQIIPIEYVPVSELTPIIQPIISSSGNLVANPRNNLLIVSDFAINIRRILIILKEIDVDAFQNTRMGFFQPKFSDVKTIAEELKEIINALNLSKDGTVSMVPLERINSLVVFCSSSSLLRTVEEWFRRLDEEVTSEQKIFVYPVKNVKAEEIANILKVIYETGDATTPQKPKAAPAAKNAKLPQVPVTKTSETKIEIVTFEPTNALVILAPPGLYREITETIKKLDVYPLEVLIEVIIAEVSLDDTDKFGIQWSTLHSVEIKEDSFTGYAQSRSSEIPSFSVPPTLIGTTQATGLSYLLYKPDNFVAMLHALATKGKVNILSSPRLLVRNQEEASIEVGSDIPTATSTTSAAGTTTTTSTLTQNIQYKTVGIKLKIKPSVNEDKTVVLDVEQEVSDTLPNVTVGQEGFTYPSFSTRKTKTSIVVPDKQGIVIGGIMKEKKTKDYQGIPLLSSIPILGSLFRYTVDTSKKTELIILLTPHVITNSSESDQLTLEFMDKLKEVKDFLKKKEGLINTPVINEDKSAVGQ